MTDWHEMTPNEFLALQYILEETSLEDVVEGYREEAEKQDIEHNQTTLHRLADGFESFEEIRQQLVEMETSPMILIRGVGDD